MSFAGALSYTVAGEVNDVSPFQMPDPGKGFPHPVLQL